MKERTIKTEERVESVVIPPLKQQSAVFEIVGTTPYLQLRFSEKAKNAIRTTQEAGSTAKSKKKREARNFKEDYEQAQYISEEGWNGIPASAFRGAMISACRLVGFKMTLAKLSIFIVADGIDKFDGTPLVRIYGKPEMHISAVRNANGSVDLRARAMWRDWSAKVCVEWDGDQFTAKDVANLMQRVGKQVGVGEGRNDSRNSPGLGLGCFATK